MSTARRVRPKLRALPRPEPQPAGAEKLSDEALIEAVVRGDAAVAAELYARLAHVIDCTLYRILGRREPEHEDLIQSTFEQVIRTLVMRRFARACSLTRWAGSVATHVGLNALRARRRERGVFDHFSDASSTDVATADDPERRADARHALDQVRDLLATISEARAEAVVLHDVFGYDLAEIAALTGSTISAAQSRLVRGRHELIDKYRDACKQRGGAS